MNNPIIPKTAYLADYTLSVEDFLQMWQEENYIYISTLNQKYWMDKVTEYVQDYDLFEHTESGEDLYLVLDETPQPVVGVVGKAYTWEEVLQELKEKDELAQEHSTKSPNAL